MKHDCHPTDTGHIRLGAAQARIAATLTAAACFTSACGAEVEPEATDAPLQQGLEPEFSASRAPPGSLLLEAGYAGAEPAPLAGLAHPPCTSGRCPPRTIGYSPTSAWRVAGA